MSAPIAAAIGSSISQTCEAPAFDAAFVVRPTDQTPFADLPLAWFAVFEERVRTAEPAGDAPPLSWRPSIDATRHAADVAQIREHIRAGDTYQVNHTFRLSAPFDGDAAGLYAGRTWLAKGGPGVAAGLGALYLGGFGASHPLAKKIGAWPAVLSVAAASAGASWAAVDTKDGRR